MISSAPPSSAHLELDAEKKIIVRRKIVIWDRNPVLADGLCLILRADAFLSTFDIVSKTQDNFASVMNLAPDILIVNPWHTALPGEGALDHFIDIPDETFVICYCSGMSNFDVQQLTALGFRGIVSTTVGSGELVRIVSSVAFGGTYISDIYQQNSLVAGVPTSGKFRQLEALTEREVEVLQRLALGSSMKEVAAALKISTKTADTYKTRANRKLNLHSRADIVRYALDAGWLT